jgi:hypothetical protein
MHITLGRVHSSTGREGSDIRFFGKVLIGKKLRPGTKLPGGFQHKRLLKAIKTHTQIYDFLKTFKDPQQP